MPNFYKKFVRPSIQRKRYKKLIKFMFGVIRHLMLKKPCVLTIETGTICNINCPTCPTPRDVVVAARSAKNMNFDVFKRIICNSHRYFTSVMLYWSNEPLMNRDIVRMVHLCNELNLYTFISTNVTLLDEKIFRELIEAGLDELLVCFDGFSEKSYECFRKGANFKRVKNNIEMICRIKREQKAINPWIEIQYIVNKLNEHEVTACKEWGKEVGVDGFRLEDIYIVNYLNNVSQLRNELYTEKMWNNFYKKNRLVRKMKCRNPNLQVCILVDGQATICCHDIKGTCCFGDLSNRSFEEIALDKKYLEIKKKGIERKLAICKGC